MMLLANWCVLRLSCGMILAFIGLFSVSLDWIPSLGWCITGINIPEHICSRWMEQNPLMNDLSTHSADLCMDIV